ncbi:hypothetical protein PVAND_008269 [Polypedilum vanderplanki]|uniref:Uncharacterized protein n=1 Tax=Polypedilum vanderplanki TaxID=319348 RepID=A0A9J6C9P0_POLVA|nr:hypothetical protein PVAND_008269 [Polypedilum vanderplanki]
MSQKNFCRICNAQCKLQKISETMPTDIRQYLDPSSPAKMIENAIKVIKFQHELRLHSIKSQYQFRKKYDMLKKKASEMMQYKKKVLKMIEREKKFCDILKHAYHTKNITSDLFKLGKSDNDRQPLTNVNPSSSKSNASSNENNNCSSIYSPLARFSMMNKSYGDNTKKTPPSFFKENSSNNLSRFSQQENKEKNDANSESEHRLLQNARNMLMVNTMRSMAESNKLHTQQYNQSHSSQDMNEMIKKKMRL